MRAVPEGSKQGSSTSSCACMALLGQFRRAENKTGSFDETAGYRSCRSPLELCAYVPCGRLEWLTSRSRWVDEVVDL